MALMADPLREALEAMVAEKCDYMTINKLGDPEAQHTVKQARAALAQPTPADPWQPIKTAPSDGTLFVAAIKVFLAKTHKFSHWDRHIIAIDDDGEGIGGVVDDYYQGWDLEHYTHWTPLREPPLDQGTSPATDETERPLTDEEHGMIDSAWEKHKAAVPVTATEATEDKIFKAALLKSHDVVGTITEPPTEGTG